MKYFLKNHKAGFFIRRASRKDPVWWIRDRAGHKYIMWFAINSIVRKGERGFQVIVGPINFLFGWLVIEQGDQ